MCRSVYSASREGSQNITRGLTGVRISVTLISFSSAASLFTVDKEAWAEAWVGVGKGVL